MSEVTELTNEVQILRHITAVATEGHEDGIQHITKLLDEFDCHSPNGIHKCLVIEPMGPSVNTMVEELPQFKPRKRGMRIRYPPWMARSILKQSTSTSISP